MSSTTRDLLGDLAHRADGLLNGLAPFFGLAAGLVGGAGRVLGVLGVPRHRGVDRLQALAISWSVPACSVALERVAGRCY